MTRLLIAVHGMGSNPPHWSDAVKEKLDAVAARYTEFASGRPSFTSRIEFREVCYDDVIVDYVAKWNESHEAFATFVKAQGDAWDPSALVKWLADPSLPADTKGFFWSTAIDPILYRGASIVRDDVRSSVMQQIVQHVTALTAGGAVQASILAHSLGTIVAHDVLQQLASGAAGGNDAFKADRWNFENFFFLADVCVLGPRQLVDLDPRTLRDDYLVRPMSASAVGARKWYANRMYSFRHEWDPFVRWAPFLPESWGLAAWGQGFVSPPPLQHYHSANVHGFMHYLDHPVVHIPIINHTLGFFAIPASEAAEAVAKYPKLGAPECQAEIAGVRAFVSQLPQSCDDLTTLATAVATFQAKAKRAMQACGEAFA